MAVRFVGFVSLLLFSALLLPCSIHATQVDYCERGGDYDVEVKGVKISPDPVVRGKPATFNISASTGKAISGGQVVIDVYYFGAHIHSETHDLCEETSCPISAGDFLLSHTQSLPGFTPPGPYTLKMKMLSGNELELTCIKFGFKIKIRSPIADS
eukprot:TRINITY_DN7108_c1_g1_i5.p1 TRINITY_DN7108_c1_g1~~TRINITY_DN7108_c1_g1_i5.p1  ORF type:complete len:155 (-),score=16.62 TRINITY_DN7108_c1_g1_i5:683-1147(-)